VAGRSLLYSLGMSNTSTSAPPQYRTRDERRWKVQCIKSFGLIKEGQIFTVARSAYGLALFRECDLPRCTSHPILAIHEDGDFGVVNKFFAFI